MSEKRAGVVNIRGREYTTVAKRVSDFREKHPDWSISTAILERNAGMVLMRAEIADSAGRTLATGHAEEWRKSSEINRTSAIENAETSAIGRALAALGYGGQEFASVNEIEIAERKKTIGMSATQVNHDEFAALPPEAQDALRECAMEVIALCDEDRLADALAVVAGMCNTQEDKMALWSLLPSKTRAALKKASQKEAA